MNGVKYGGNTVFIKPAIAVEPIKGSAIMWYNLYPSGKGNSNTHHAACPVVIGEKWGEIMKLSLDVKIDTK